jgi:zinc D-Ala-D-Ala carboxypeptidase
MASSYREPARAATHRLPGILVAGLLVVSAAIAAVSGYQLLASSSSTAAPPVDVSPSSGPPPSSPPPSPPPSSPPSSPPLPPRGEHRGPLGEADGAVPDGTTVFDDEVPGVANLDPALLGSLRQAATDAADDGVELQVTSGWRSPEYQEQLLREAVSEYGSEEEAARWVATADTSLHVSGDAVDIGPSDATAWLSEQGDDYGLCQIYGNEPWHYELRTEAIDHGCPPMYADPTQDPRMQQ